MMAHITVGCTINAWFICPESYSPDAKQMTGACVFTGMVVQQQP